jgi:hypothetical protein
MDNLLNDEEAKAVSTAVKTVKETAFLTTSVYPMRVHAWERKLDKNEKQYLRVMLDTGFLTSKGEPRYLNTMFYLDGKYPDGTDRIDDLARFLKMCFKLKEVTNQNLALTKNRMIAVATKKDAEGYIQYWYADHIENLPTMKASYKPKLEYAKQSNPSGEDVTAKMENMVNNSQKSNEEKEPEFLQGVKDEDAPF